MVFRRLEENDSVYYKKMNIKVDGYDVYIINDYHLCVVIDDSGCVYTPRISFLPHFWYTTKMDFPKLTINNNEYELELANTSLLLRRIVRITDEEESDLVDYENAMVEAKAEERTYFCAWLTRMIKKKQEYISMLNELIVELSSTAILE